MSYEGLGVPKYLTDSYPKRDRQVVERCGAEPNPIAFPGDRLSACVEPDGHDGNHRGKLLVKGFWVDWSDTDSNGPCCCGEVHE